MVVTGGFRLGMSQRARPKPGGGVRHHRVRRGVVIMQVPIVGADQGNRLHRGVLV